jgi:hypothetical protein
LVAKDKKWKKWKLVAKDDPAGEGYDWLRLNKPDVGALCARIRAEFTMHNALSVAFLAVTVMAYIAGEYWWAVASGSAAPLMAFRGATTEKTFQKTTRKFCKEAGHELPEVCKEAGHELSSGAGPGAITKFCKEAGHELPEVL